MALPRSEALLRIFPSKAEELLLPACAEARRRTVAGVCLGSVSASLSFTSFLLLRTQELSPQDATEASKSQAAMDTLLNLTCDLLCLCIDWCWSAGFS